MNSKLHYKRDELFIRYLAMGYVGEQAAMKLMTSYGHQFSFDAYGSGSFEIYKDARKKKQRTADLVCERCRQRLEVRAKGTMKISMSDSPSRRFDRELQPIDWVGFVHVRIKDKSLDPLDPTSYEEPTEIYVISVSELSRTRELAIPSDTKAESAGSESYLTWPTMITKFDGVYGGVDKERSLVKFLNARTGQEEFLPAPIQGKSYIYNDLKIGDKVSRYSTLVCGVAKTLSKDQLRCSSA